jgi:rfaE bifunctional protein nucleotidyltransferase chain/domain
LGKILDNEKLEVWIEVFKQKTRKLVFTNGCFDILHSGHVDYLQKARLLGDTLLVGLNSDESVRKLKGENRPIINGHSRASVLAALEVVDAVILFEDETPDRLIKRVLPNILVKGGDYQKEDIVGYDTVINNGGRVEVLPFLEGHSTTNIINKIKEHG